MPGQSRPKQQGPEAQKSSSATGSAGPAVGKENSAPGTGMEAPDQSQGPVAQGKGGVAAATPPAAPNKGKQQAAVSDMGSVKTLDGGFCGKAGTVVDALVPDVGQSGKVTVNVNVPVAPAVNIGLEMVASAERDEKGIKVRFQLGGTVTAVADAWILEAWATAKIYGYIEAYGDSGSECFRLMLLGVQQRIAGASSKLADAMFDGKFIKDTINNMDDDDYVETGLGASLSAGVGTAPGIEGGAQASGAAEASIGTKLSKGKNGKLQKEDVMQWSVGLGFEKEPFSFEGKFTAKEKAKAFEGCEVEISAKESLSIGELDKVINKQLISGLVTNMVGAVRGTSGMFQKNPTTAQKVGSFANFLSGQTGAGLAVQSGTHAALSRAGGSFAGLKVGHKITVKGALSGEGKPSLEIKLERTSEIQFGANPRSKVFVLLENVQPVFSVKIGG